MRSLRWLVNSGIATLFSLVWCDLASSQPMNLGMVSSSIVSGNYQFVVYEGVTAYVASGYGVRIMDITDPGNPFEIAHLPTDGLAKSVAVSAGPVLPVPRASSRSRQGENRKELDREGGPELPAPGARRVPR